MLVIYKIWIINERYNQVLKLAVLNEKFMSNMESHTRDKFNIVPISVTYV